MDTGMKVWSAVLLILGNWLYLSKINHYDATILCRIAFCHILFPTASTRFFNSHRTIDLMVMDTYFNIGVSDFKSHFSIILWTIVDTTRSLLLSSTPEEYEISPKSGLYNK